MSDPRYPVGRFQADANPTPESRAHHIEQIADLPRRFRQALSGFDRNQLNTPYREGSWTVLQLAHHVPDSHMQAYIRFKLALTEDTQNISLYKQDAWAHLKDSELTPLEVSLTILESVHSRWAVLLKSMQAEDFHRKYNHPEQGIHTLDRLLATYSWHGNHHAAHITSLRERMKW